MYFKIITIFILSFPLIGQGTQPELIPKDTLYQSSVKSVWFSKAGKPVIAPIIYLNEFEPLYLQFDLLQGSPKKLYYSLYYCNQDWTFSNLDYSETISGFEETEINNFSTSQLTLIPYVHYEFIVPGNQNTFKVSGNYLLVVFDQDGSLFFSRRIYVTDYSFRVKTKFLSPVNALQVRTHQSLEITVNTNHVQVRNPSKEIKLEVLQNGNPNTKLSFSEPNYFSGDLLQYNKQDGILFPAMKEYRRKDIRTILHVTQDIDYWDEKDGNYNGWLEKDLDRSYKPYYTEADINGQFILASNDVQNDVIRSEYVLAHFSLALPSPLEYPVFIYGAMTDWDLKPEYLMTWDPSRKAYMGEVLLKNGFYNFMYATQDEGDTAVTSTLEGDWYETENSYLVLVYFRPFGGRFDQLVFAYTFNSNQ